MGKLADAAGVLFGVNVILAAMPTSLTDEAGYMNILHNKILK